MLDTLSARQLSRGVRPPSERRRELPEFHGVALRRFLTLRMSRRAFNAASGKSSIRDSLTRGRLDAVVRRGVEDNMTQDEHKERHEELHKKLDELVADFIGHTGRLPSQTTVMELINWSYQQTQEPTETQEASA